ncbi:Crp/Fnr family transcriptional regulator [Paenibacillus popilliae]|uniref:cAMP-binding protein n=1 Tax=Paenibacillus popilliae ATCC 14706 TaxID=1212764 RepID=M9M3C9_PAEPP|nr:Crp/Fnr family transcriptional regulator [Paenibacillus popilliae]GAC41678.1 cAMP-binding protein [Paenibacillus popilliae ATCC 14706]
MKITLHRGEILFRQGDPGTYLYRIVSGLFKVTRLHENGNIVLFNILYPGEMVPHHSLISPKDCHGTATAMVTSTVKRMKAEAWYEELRNNSGKALEVAKLLQEKLRFMQQRLDHLTIGSPAERLALLTRWLDSMTNKTPLTDMLTQEEIGQLIGVRRETVNRLLRQSDNSMTKR